MANRFALRGSFVDSQNTQFVTVHATTTGGQPRTGTPCQQICRNTRETLSNLRPSGMVIARAIPSLSISEVAPPHGQVNGKVIARFALIRLDKRKRAVRDRRLDEHLLVTAVGAVKAQLAPKQFSQQGHVDVGGRFVALRVALSATG